MFVKVLGEIRFECLNTRRSASGDAVVLVERERYAAKSQNRRGEHVEECGECWRRRLNYAVADRDSVVIESEFWSWGLWSRESRRFLARQERWGARWISKRILCLPNPVRRGKTRTMKTKAFVIALPLIGTVRHLL